MSIGPDGKPPSKADISMCSLQTSRDMAEVQLCSLGYAETAKTTCRV